MGFAAIGSTFHLSFAFIRDEKEELYEVILSCLTEAYESLSLDPPYPYTILTNKEQALINAIKSVFLETKHILYI